MVTFPTPRDSFRTCWVVTHRLRIDTTKHADSCEGPPDVALQHLQTAVTLERGERLLLLHPHLVSLMSPIVEVGYQHDDFALPSGLHVQRRGRLVRRRCRREHAVYQIIAAVLREDREASKSFWKQCPPCRSVY